jgi:hypothetical protein
MDKHIPKERYIFSIYQEADHDTEMIKRWPKNLEADSDWPIQNCEVYFHLNTDLSNLISPTPDPIPTTQIRATILPSIPTEAIKKRKTIFWWWLHTKYWQ